MKNFYDTLFDLIANSEPKTDTDIDTLYRYAAGNDRHDLHILAAHTSSDEFRAVYRQVEKDVAESSID